MKKPIDINDLTRAQALKEGESLISSNYVITCTEQGQSYLIEFYTVKK